MSEIDANERLAAAERAGERVRRRSRWPRWLYIGYAIAGFVYITTCGLRVSEGVFFAAFAFWIAAACGLTIFAMSRRVEPRGYGIRFAVTVAVWFFAWTIVLTLGAIFFKHNLAWYVPGALVTSGIMLAGGWLDARAARR